jgi:hypothetical protein
VEPYELNEGISPDIQETGRHLRQATPIKNIKAIDKWLDALKEGDYEERNKR